MSKNTQKSPAYIFLTLGLTLAAIENAEALKRAKEEKEKQNGQALKGQGKVKEDQNAVKRVLASKLDIQPKVGMTKNPQAPTMTNRGMRGR